ncbi:DHHA1 domain-containing protein [Nanoarchaeota archaeon]
MVTLVVVDHHRSDFLDKSRVNIPKFNNPDEYIKELSKYFEKDYDLILSDADPDGYVSSIIFCLEKGFRDPNYKCFRIPLDKEIIEIFEKNNIKSIIAFDWFPLYGCDLSLFEDVVLLNPVFSNLLDNTCTAELVFRACKKKTKFMRDLAAITIVSDYAVSGGLSTLSETIIDYPELFSSLLPLVEDNKLNRYNVFQSRFKELSEIFWSPYIINGEKGAQRLVQLLLSNPAFTYTDIFNFEHKPTIKFLRRAWHEFKHVLREESISFKTRRKEINNVLIYEPNISSPGFVQKFSSMLCDTNIGKIIMLKVRVNSKTKYSLRQRGLLIDLGKILQDMGVGGGHPEAAGAVVEDTESFEKDFIARVSLT